MAIMIRLRRCRNNRAIFLLPLLLWMMLLLLWFSNNPWSSDEMATTTTSTTIFCQALLLPNKSSFLRHKTKSTINNNNNKNKSHLHGSSPFSLYSTGISRGGGGDGEDFTSPSNNNNNNNDNNNERIVDKDEHNDDNAFQGRALLCLVALLYGTLNVSLRLIYQLPDPPSASVMSAARGWLATACFLPLLIFNKNHQQEDQSDSVDVSTTTTTSTTNSNNNNNNIMQLAVAGLELAVWNFLAQGLLNIGLLSTGSARASFLTQTSVVLTPIISIFAGQVVPSIVWTACGIALVGLTLLSGGGGGGGGSAGGGLASLLSFSQGDCLVLGGALAWSLYLFRLSKIGSKFNEIKLQAVKTLLLAILYSGWVAYSIVFGGGSGSIFSSWMTSLVAWATLLYSALGPGTLADVLQQQGQKSVSASEANVLLSMEPVFAALCAWLCLGEVLSTKELIGGGIILLAALVATSMPTTTKTSTNNEDDNSL